MRPSETWDLFLGWSQVSGIQIATLLRVATCTQSTCFVFAEKRKSSGKSRSPMKTSRERHDSPRGSKATQSCFTQDKYNGNLWSILNNSRTCAELCPKYKFICCVAFVWATVWCMLVAEACNLSFLWRNDATSLWSGQSLFSLLVAFHVPFL